MGRSHGKILVMDRPRFWGLPRQEMVKDLLPRIREAGEGYEVQYLDRQAELGAEDFENRTRLTAEAIPGARIMAGFDLGPEALARADCLEWIHIFSAGIEYVLYPELVDSDVILTSAKGSGGVPMAEFAMMQMLMFAKRALQYAQAQQSREWAPHHHRELNGLTVGVIGLGHSGADLAGKCKAFHMRVLGLRRTDKSCPHVDEMFTRDSLLEMLPQCDFVAITTPTTPETRGMLGPAEFQAMKRSAFLVVTSRGGVADDDALLRALHEGWIAGAALDAHTTEPLPPESPFWTAPNAVVTPHSAAAGQGVEPRLGDLFIENIRRFVRGEPLREVVDKHAAY